MRDLAGLIVIDFIDMESRKNNAMVERRMKDSLKNDRARIQVGSISHFGLMEMSRQRLRPSLAEASLVTCPHCAGMGHVRSPESAALHILRAVEDEGAKFRAAEILVTLPPDVALYLFNHKRDRLSAIEARYAMRIIFSGDVSLTAANFRIEKTRAQTAPLPAPAPAPQVSRPAPEPIADEGDEESEETGAEESATPVPGETAEEGERRRRRRRRRGKRRPESGSAAPTEAAEPEISGPSPEADAPSEIDLALAAELGDPAEPGDTPEPAAEGDAKPARRRRVRGGRRRTGGAESGIAEGGEDHAEPGPAPQVVYADIADIFEAAERAEEAQRLRAHIVIEAEPASAPEPEYAAAEPYLETIAAEPAEPAHQAFEPESEPVAAVSPPPAAPLVKPTLIGAEEGPVEKKRGWWRR
jgi:ribonuclease E